MQNTRLREEVIVLLTYETKCTQEQLFPCAFLSSLGAQGHQFYPKD